jgi:tRNA-specific 2-thiouridylase
MEKNLGETRGTTPGPVVDRAGRRLGSHRGIIHYTVGQRRGLGIAASDPLYVLEVDAASNAVVVGSRTELDCEGLVTEPVNWLMRTPPADGAAVTVKIRAHHPAAAGRLVHAEQGTIEIRFDVPQAAVTPGQLAVIYDGDRVLGGAPIAARLPARPVPEPVI